MTDDVIDELHWRGLIAQSTDEDALRAALAEGPVTYYCGFDPTAPSLHVGHLLQFMVLRRAAAGRPPAVALVGGATGLIGDPRPTAERQLNDPETVAAWVAAHPRAGRAVPRPAGRARRPAGSDLRQQPRLDRRRCRRSTSCATSASTSGSTRCWPRRRCPPG